MPHEKSPLWRSDTGARHAVPGAADPHPPRASRPSADRILALADQCVKCGLCLPVCPTYALDQSEAESPRGRIAIAAALARGDVEPTAALREHLDHCLGCMHCERVCPANVQYAELLVETRALLGPSPQRPRLLLALIKHPGWLRRLQQTARWMQWPRWRSLLLPLLSGHSAWRAALLALPTSAPATPVRVTAASSATSRS